MLDSANCWVIVDDVLMPNSIDTYEDQMGGNVKPRVATFREHHMVQSSPNYATLFKET